MLLVVLVSVLVSVSAQHVCYMLPDGSSPLNCPAQPCLTLDQYTKQRGTYFTTGATFLFLAGNHSLQAAVTLTNISDVTLRGEGNDSQVIVICRSGVTIQCDSTSNVKIEKLSFMLDVSKSRISLALNISLSNNVKISCCTFQSLYTNSGSAISLFASSVGIIYCAFNQIFISRLRNSGGAICALNANLTVSASKFIRNRAHDGGAIKMNGGHLHLKAVGSVFEHNSATRNGGAIYCDNCTITAVTDYATSHSTSYSTLCRKVSDEWLNRTDTIFTGNRAKKYGGAIYTARSNIQLSAMNIQFEGNEASSNGGAICTFHNFYVILGRLVKYTNNKAKYGGVVAIEYRTNSEQILISGTFVNNSCICGGAVYIKNAIYKIRHHVVSIKDITAVNNRRSAVCLHNTNVMFNGTNLTSNTVGLYADNSFITMNGYTYIASNRANNGGGIYSIGGTISLNGPTLFSHNTADEDGGVLHATGTDITLYSKVKFISNTAQNGGALFLSKATFLNINHHTTLTTSLNHAFLYGGAIYHEEKSSDYACSNLKRSIGKKSSSCFLRLIKYREAFFSSYHDSADKDGSFLYGGSLDKCKLSVNGTYNYNINPYIFLTKNIFNITSNQNKENEISSLPYKLEFCEDHPQHKRVSISRGQCFTVSIKAIRTIGLKPVQVTALPGTNARIHLNQVTQTVSSSNCTDLMYSFYSSQGQDKLRLTTRGSCGDTGTVEVVIRVTLLPCPHPFVQHDEECVCDKKLLEYPNVNCTTDERNNSYVTKGQGTDFWMNVSYNINGSYEGLILCKTCPPKYCRTGTVAVSVDDLDSQCDKNRGGVLCGQCLANYSLMLGSSTCTNCSHQHLALLFPFAAAGIALVFFLSFLRLTVATAMINSVILYANILQANGNFFFPVNARNILTVSIAWMNLDLGFETCFYNGMTAFAQTWLQFAFPFYVWLLISLIILSSRYSITVSRLIGHNPIAVLATLILMSYTKLLKIIIEVYSSVDLAYPDNQTVTVWLKDANVPYLQSWHLLLTVVTTLVLVLFFLPYTLLLLLGYKLYRFAGRRYLRWVHRIRPLLESYYAPYNIYTRYWTGFLLLVRCALYIIFSLVNTNNSLLAIILTFTGLLALLPIISICFSHQLYAKAHNNIMEIFTYLNLIVLSAATLAGANSPALVYSLVGLVFIAMLGIIVYHFHLLYIAKSQVWQQLKVKVSTLKEKLTHSTTSTAAGPPVDAGNAHNPPKMVTHSELREPLLQED